MIAQAGWGDEADKLLAAVEGWLRTASSAAPGEPAGDLSGEPAPHRCESPCQICPICQLISVARKLRPDVVEHLAEAVGSVVLAFRALTEAPLDDRPGSAQPAENFGQSPVEKADQTAIVVQRIPIH